MANQETKEKALALLEVVNLLSLGAAQGSYQDAMTLVYALVPDGPDSGPEIQLTPEIRAVYSPRERLAITVAHDWASKFNRNFGVGSSIHGELEWSNVHLQAFALNLGRAIHGILHPDGEYGLNPTDYMVLTNDSLDGLINWAEDLFKSRVGTYPIPGI